MKNIKNESTQAQTLEEYFIVIGVDPRISLNNFLYNTNIDELNNFFIKDEIYPRILSKFPPVKKSYIDIHSSIIDLCFPNEFKLEEYESQPEPIIQHFLLDNSFYSLDYLLKYVTCLKIYESLEQYFLLKNEIKKTFGENYHNSLKLFGTGRKTKKYKSENKLNIWFNSKGRHKSEFEIIDDGNIIANKNLKIFKKYYFPKILCLVSTQPFFKEQENILKQIYQYYLDKTPKKYPLEKIILNILLNIPLPPKGLLEIRYNIAQNSEKIIFKNSKMNELSNIDDQLKLIFSKFSINKILIIFFNILFENKIVFFSSNANSISYFIHGMLSLLFPFHYSFQISSSIPKEALEVIESISPFILGFNTFFSKNFFSKNKIDANDLNLLIIDLDGNNIKRIGKDFLPNIPKFLYQTLYDELNKNYNLEKNKINYSNIRKAFFDFFINMLNDYENFLNKDSFLKNLTNTGIKGLFKINEFIELHNNDKNFFKKLTETQMFCDFITKKVIPKDKKESLEILFFDENIIKKNSKKFFSKQKKNIILLNSKKYEFNNIYEIPKVKNLSNKEKKIFEKEEDRNNLILYGQKITEEKDEISGEKKYLFNYFLFPILNKYFVESISLNEYFLFSSEYPDMDSINSEIIFQTMNNSNKKNNVNIIEREIKNYIYLSYIELWAFSYWYFDPSEKNEKFNQLLKFLDKINIHEIEIYENLFKALNKFQESEKIVALYEKLLEFKINPSSYIFSLVNALKKKKREKKNILFNNSLNTELNSKLKRTFHSNNESTILGDKVIFKIKQPCSECLKEINILELSLNYKNIKKDIFWATCPYCKKEILPQMDVSLGNNLYLNTNKITRFTLLSIHEIKNIIKDIINKDEMKMFHVINFKENYTNLFWSCVWYFKINKMDLDIILPYEHNVIQKLNPKKISLNNISTLIKPDKDDNKEKILDKKYLKRKNKKKIYNKDILIIHKVHSFNLNIKELKYFKSEEINIEDKKRKTFDFNFSRIRNETMSEKDIYSSLGKQNKLHEKINNDRLNKKENLLSLNYEEMIEKNEELETDDIYSNKNSLNFVNYEGSNNNLCKPKKHRWSIINTSCQNIFNDENIINIDKIRNKRNKSEKIKKLDKALYF